MITFTRIDDPDAAREMLQAAAQSNLPMLGLVIKVNERDEVLNVELTDEETVKALAVAQIQSNS